MRSLGWVKSAALLIVLSIVTVVSAGCDAGPRVLIRDPSGAVIARVRVEVAGTPAKRELGLMFRHHLDAGAGMLFVFPKTNQVYFWMRNTEIPLDMIFVGADGRVAGVVAHAQPYSDKLLTVDAKVRYVLEVNAGFAKSHGIRRGDQFDFEGFTPIATS